MSRESQDLSGRIIASQFRLTQKLGAGGMGTVYLAKQLDMEREVVLKVLHPELTAGSPQAVERFKREARAVAKLNHPHIVQVFVFGQMDDGQLYLAMEYIDGKTVSEVVAMAGRLSPIRAMRITEQIAEALVEAHGHGVVHRDLKPENIMLTQRHGNADYVKVLDFGIAQMQDGEHLTQSGAVFGTPRYMSPEQGRGQPLDARSDLYSLGVIIYEMLSGRHPFDAHSTLDYLMKHVSEPVLPPSERVDGLQLPPRVEALVLQCLEKDPANRPASAADLLRDVRQAIRDFPYAMRGFASTEVPIAKASRSYTPLLVTAALTFGILAGGWWWFSASDRPIDPPKVAAVVPKVAVEPPKVAVEPPKTAVEPPKVAVEPPKVAVDPPKYKPPTITPPSVDRWAGDMPLPRGAVLKYESNQASGWTLPLDGQTARAFYEQHLGVRFGVDHIKRVANALQLEGDDIPFSFIGFLPDPAGVLVSVTPNAMYVPKVPPKPITEAFGVKVPEGSHLRMRTPTMTTFEITTSGKPLFDYLEAEYGQVPKTMVNRSEDGRHMSIIAPMTGKSAWKMIAVNFDSPTVFTVSVMARD